MGRLQPKFLLFPLPLLQVGPARRLDAPNPCPIRCGRAAQYTTTITANLTITKMIYEYSDKIGRLFSPTVKTK